MYLSYSIAVNCYLLKSLHNFTTEQQQRKCQNQHSVSMNK